MELNYFMHIDSTNLASYFGCACLKPSKYFTNRVDDVQNKFDSFILLSEKRYANETDCSLEIILTNEEKENLIPVNGNKDILLFRKAIPISRVRKIYFKSDNTKDKIITLVKMSSAFIPDNMATVIVENNAATYSNLEIAQNTNPSDLTDSIKIFDKLLGGFALMRLANDGIVNYSENYFSTLSRFNSVIEAEYLNANKKISDLYWDAFEGKSSFRILFPYINKCITSEDVDNIAKAEGQRIQKDKLSGIIDYNLLERGTYIIAVLYSFGMSDEGRKNKIDGLILNNFKKEIKPDKSEVIALCYGLNRGYSGFTNKYKSFNSEKVVKFELNSQLDYYTIESLYQYAFNGINKSSEFPYLDSWCQKYPKLKRKLKKSEYYILDKLILCEVIKVGSNKWWSGVMQSFFSKSGEELFKPFMEKFFEKIKTDIEEESQENIAEKNNTISELTIENNNLQKRISDVDDLQKQIVALKSEIESLKTKSNVVAESGSTYSNLPKSDSHNADLVKRYESLQRLVKDISKQSNMTKAKELIKKFNDTDSSVSTIVFPDK